MDELTLTSTPDQAPMYGKAGRRQPSFPMGTGGEKKHRLGGAVNAFTGETFFVEGEIVGEKALTELFGKIEQRHPDLRLAGIIMDNWFAHKSKLVEAFFAAHPKLTRKFLPTYSPWLNRIEKLWKMLRQQFWHTNRYAGKWEELLSKLRQFLNGLKDRAKEVCSYLGLKCPP